MKTTTQLLNKLASLIFQTTFAAGSKRTNNREKITRRTTIESLENRSLMAADVFAAYKQDIPNSNSLELNAVGASGMAAELSSAMPSNTSFNLSLLGGDRKNSPSLESSIVNNNANGPTISIQNGVLAISGTNDNESISLSQQNNRITVNYYRSSIGYLQVVSSLQSTFDIAQIESIKIDSKGGDDTIRLDGNGIPQSAVKINSDIQAGDGNDTVIGGDGNDAIDGGAGTNVLRGGSGKNTLRDNGQLLLRPTLVISIHGNSQGKAEGEVWGNQIAELISKSGSQTVLRTIEWSTSGNQQAGPINEASQIIGQFLRDAGEEFDVVIFGHSRGGVFAANLANKLKEPGNGFRNSYEANLGNIYLILSDPTAATIWNDKYTKAVNNEIFGSLYDDGNVFPGASTIEGRSIGGLNYYNVQNELSHYSRKDNGGYAPFNSLLDVLGVDFAFKDHSNMPNWLTAESNSFIQADIQKLISMKQGESANNSRTFSYENWRMESDKLEFNAETTLAMVVDALWGTLTKAMPDYALNVAKEVTLQALHYIESIAVNLGMNEYGKQKIHELFDFADKLTIKLYDSGRLVNREVSQGIKAAILDPIVDLMGREIGANLDKLFDGSIEIKMLANVGKIDPPSMKAILNSLDINKLGGMLSKLDGETLNTIIQGLDVSNLRALIQKLDGSTLSNVLNEASLTQLTGIFSTFDKNIAQKLISNLTAAKLQNVLANLTDGNIAKLMNTIDSTSLGIVTSVFSDAKIAQLISQVNTTTLRNAMETLSARTLGDVLEHFDGRKLTQALDQLSPARISDALRYVDKSTMKAAFSRLSDSKLANVMEELNTKTLAKAVDAMKLDRLTSILKRVDHGTLKAALKEVSINDAKKIVDKIGGKAADVAKEFLKKVNPTGFSKAFGNASKKWRIKW